MIWKGDICRSKSKENPVQDILAFRGWRRGGYTYTDGKFQYAKSQGLMFNPLTISHDEGLNVLSFERVKWGGVRLN
ncbi:hypothetical protein PAJ34TS1_39650 [Paenibacillus azoreducens]